MTQSRPRVVVVGGGFAGFHALRKLERLLPPEAADLVLVNPTDYLLYSPLLPDVTAGLLEPRHVAVSLRYQLPRTELILGRATDVDVSGTTLQVDLLGDGDRVSRTISLDWDRLALVSGSVTRQFDIPGVAERAHGVKTLIEARYLRDHLLAQLDRADALPDTPEGRAERQQRLTVVAVGAGYTGTEIVAQLQHELTSVASRWNRVTPDDVRFVLIDLADTVLPELGKSLGDVAMGALRRRGIDVRLGVTVKEARDTEVELTDGTTVPSRTLIWGAGVTASPLVTKVGTKLQRGRLVVDAELRVPGAPGVFAAGDAAAVPDLVVARQRARQGDSDGPPPVTPPTAQHAQRQGTALGRNTAADLGVGRARPYRHRDLGLVADLGGRDAVAKPLGVNLQGPLAKAVARGYHLYALPAAANRVRVAVDWLLSAALPTQDVQVGAIPPEAALVATAQQTERYLAG
ncbi:NAD(P)/FAD-dependent oxidoreductase [Geodermatophilus sp. TF02-6]|uniref:NAD(P)/FAD-dependent oxidoreductase n=1 Tax=Geodermatophilus sp. TF02-6 TaxID=2250575 RepID=UPI000DE82C29|nr:FAD-dependent oxidoreductase [Geodermatophilus sp. TF02-6]RBY80633.1 NAD(P)/FAD-dependent oxidoreductase [Geodermatophilus sp. TF02-6]